MGAEDVLAYWFGTLRADGDVDPAVARRWFEVRPETDREIRDRFGDALAGAVAGELDGWADTARGRLALILLIDQFSRNIHRGRPEAFAGDAIARRLCLDGLAAGVDRELGVVERSFFYLPLEHGEDVELQRRSVECFTRLAAEAPTSLAPRCREALRWAERHRDAIARFGRFPHRNAVLGRRPMPEEERFLGEHDGFL